VLTPHQSSHEKRSKTTKSANDQPDIISNPLPRKRACQNGGANNIFFHKSTGKPFHLPLWWKRRLINFFWPNTASMHISLMGFKSIRLSTIKRYRSWYDTSRRHKPLQKLTGPCASEEFKALSAWDWSPRPHPNKTIAFLQPRGFFSRESLLFTLAEAISLVFTICAIFKPGNHHHQKPFFHINPMTTPPPRWGQKSQYRQQFHCHWKR